MRSTSQPENVVPIKLAPPMMPTAVAAVSCGMPRSIACGIRCVPIRPLAVTPQMKKQPLKIQKVEVAKTSERADMDIGRISPERKCVRASSRFHRANDTARDRHRRDYRASTTKCIGTKSAEAAAIAISALRQPLPTTIAIKSGK